MNPTLLYTDHRSIARQDIPRSITTRRSIFKQRGNPGLEAGRESRKLHYTTASISYPTLMLL